MVTPLRTRLLDPAWWRGDPQQAYRDLLGYEPIVGFAEGIERTLDSLSATPGVADG